MMTEFHLTIRTANAAFTENDGDMGYELARILRESADKIEAGNLSAHAVSVFDVNGNRVGGYVLREGDDK